MNAREHFGAGRLPEAIDAQLQEVKAAPMDAGKRTFLFELLAFAGELNRAEKQLQVIGQEGSEQGWAAGVYQNLLAAESMRRKVMAGQARPDVFLEAPAFLTRRFEALEHLAGGQAEAGIKALQESDADAPAVRGQLNGQPVSGLRDADDLLAPILEVMVLRDYVWVPWSQVQELEVQAPAHPRDLLWCPARLVLTDGEQRRCYLPMLYHGSHAAADDATKLGRLTNWVVPENDGPVRGLGQHLLVFDEGDLGLLEVREFAAA